MEDKPLLSFYDYINPKLEERFWAKVDDSAGPDACHPYLASRNQYGYGMFSFGNPSKFIAAHRASYILSYPDSDVKEGEVLHHTCKSDVGCCNVRHLERFSSHNAHMTANPDHSPGNGETLKRNTLTEQEVLEIRALFAEGMRQVDIWKLYPCSQDAISKVVRRKTWRHLPA